MHKHEINAADICPRAPAAGSKIKELSQRDQDYIIYCYKNTDSVGWNKENQRNTVMVEQ